MRRYFDLPASLLLILLALAACQTPESSNEIREQAEESTMMDSVEAPMLGEMILPATIRILAEVVEVLKPDTPAITRTACDSMPCHARIAILEVLAKGDGFDLDMNAEDTITAYFPSPALSTEELITDQEGQAMDYARASLRNGDLFIADLQLNEEANTLEKSPFVVGNLKKKNKEDE